MIYDNDTDEVTRFPTPEVLAILLALPDAQLRLLGARLVRVLDFIHARLNGEDVSDWN